MERADRMPIAGCQEASATSVSAAFASREGADLSAFQMATAPSRYRSYALLQRANEQYE